jgi:hypothetical protein
MEITERLQRKKLAEDAAKFLYDQRGTAEAKAMLTLLEHLLEEAKTVLVDANPQDVGQLQGKAQAYQLVITRLTRSNAEAMKPRGTGA